jgi:IMP cyclohydrolase
MPDATDLQQQAQANLQRIAANPYPGRGIVVGRSSAGALVQIYWIMGRSTNSRNRIFVQEQGRLRTEPLDPALVQDPTLVIYTAMDEWKGRHVVTNGDHTDRIVEALRGKRDFRDGLWGQEYEPDPPHFTPRIAGVTELTGGSAGGWLAVIKANPVDGSTLRFFYDFEELAPGFGWCVHTYMGAGEPLPSFTGDPVLVPIAGDAPALAAQYWAGLNAENRVALAVKQIGEGGAASAITLINRFDRAGGLGR